MGRQSEIPGTERAINKRVENAGELLVSATKKKTKANKDHKEAENHLLEVMHEEKVSQYVHEDMGKIYEIDETEKVRVSVWQPPKSQKAEADA